MTGTKDIGKKLAGLASRYRYPLLVLLLGLGLVLLPTGGKQTEPAPQQTAVQTVQPEELTDAEYCRQTERALEKILSSIDGAGEVKVMLTLRSGSATQYQSDYATSSQTGSDGSTGSTTEQKTVLLTRSGAYDEAAVVKTELPSFQGALVVSQGGGEASVRFALVNAVSVLLGLGADKITVVKMK